MKLIQIIFAIAGAVGFTLALPAQTPIRFSGATTLEKSIRPFAAEVGKAHNVTLELVPNGAGRGLEDLVAGKVQAAMFAGSLADLTAQINQKAPGTVDPAKLKVHPLFEMPVVVITHKSNAVGALTPEQLLGLFSGKITNWKELGGSNLPVIVVIAAPSDGVRSTFTEKVMRSAGYAASARLFQLSPDMNKAVAQIPGAVAVMSEKNATAEVRATKPTQPILVPYALITIGEPAEPLAGVITDLQARLK